MNPLWSQPVGVPAVAAERVPGSGGRPVAGPVRAATALACVGVLLPAPQPLRALAAIALIGLLPGAGPAWRLPLAGRLSRVVVATALSLAATVGASLVLLYLEQWSPQRCVVILAAVAVAGVMPGPRYWSPRRWRRP
jgi:hypothetical protein